MSEYIVHYSILCAEEFNYMMLIGHRTHGTQVIAFRRKTQCWKAWICKINQWKMRFHAFRSCVLRLWLVFDAALEIKNGLSTLMFPSTSSTWTKLLCADSENFWSSVYLDFRFSHQISSNEEQRRYFMFKIMYIIAFQLSLSNFQICLELYIEQFIYFYDY